MRNFRQAQNFVIAQFRKAQDIGLPDRGSSMDGRDSRNVTSTEAQVGYSVRVRPGF